MALTSPSNLFFLLPVAAALYFCVPRVARPAAFAVLSAALFWVLQPRQSLWLFASLGFDLIVLQWFLRRGEASPFARAALLFALLKDLWLFLACGVAQPLRGEAGSPDAAVILHLSLALALMSAARGSRVLASPAVFCGAMLFPARQRFGPFFATERAAASLAAPECSLSRAGEGLLRLTIGLAKLTLLVQKLLAICETLLRVCAEQPSVADAWLTALTAAMALFFTLSGYGDLAAGAGLLFGIEAPRITFYPFQACGARESVYRLNMPLEEALGAAVSPRSSREDGSLRAAAVSAVAPFFLAALLGLRTGSLLWAAWLAVFAVLDRLFARVLRYIPKNLLRLVTFFCLLPAYLFLVTDASQAIALLPVLAGRGGAALANDVSLYLIRSDLALLLVGAALCTSAPFSLQLWLRRRVPALWWIGAAVVCLPLWAVTLSFLIQA